MLDPAVPAEPSKEAIQYVQGMIEQMSCKIAPAGAGAGPGDAGEGPGEGPGEGAGPAAIASVTSSTSEKEIASARQTSETEERHSPLCMVARVAETLGLTVRIVGIAVMNTTE